MDSDKTKLEILTQEYLKQITGGSAGSPQLLPNFVEPPNLAPPVFPFEAPASRPGNLLLATDTPANTVVVAEVDTGGFI